MAELYPSDAELNSLSGASDAEQEVHFVTTGEAPYYTSFYKFVHRLLLVARRAGELRVYKDGALTCGVRAGKIQLGTTAISYAGCAAQALTNNQTNYVYLTLANIIAGNAVTINITGFPTDGTWFIPLATIVTAAGDYSIDDDMTDFRGRGLWQPLRDGVQADNIPLWMMRRTGDLTQLPSAGDGTNLGLAAGTHGTNSPKIASTSVGAGASATEKCRCQYALPAWYLDGQPVTLRVHARAADQAVTTAQVDAEVYEGDGEAGIGADICATAAQSVNADTAWHDLDFTITPTALVAGDMLDIELTVTIDDSGGGGDGAQVEIGEVQLLPDMKV